MHELTIERPVPVHRPMQFHRERPIRTADELAGRAPKISVRNLNFFYGANQALKDVALTLPQYCVSALIGPSGCGKSTFALALAGLVPHRVPSQLDGRIDIAGIDTHEATPAELAGEIGIVFQDPDAQLVTMKVCDEVAFGLENLCVAPAEMDTRVTDALALVGLAGREAWSPDRLSGGGRQRLALACALALAPRVLVLDEPSANLDPAGTRELFEVVAQLAAAGRHAIVLIEHDLDACIHLADRVVALDAVGEVLADGPPSEVFATAAEDLAAAGVWLPEPVRMARRLAAAGCPLPAMPVTLAEGTSALGSLLRARGELGHVGSQKAGSPTDPPVVDAGEPAAFAVRDLEVRLGGMPVLQGIDLEVPRGDLLAIVGANGAGKTTLARTLMGLHAPASGTVHLGGRDLRRMGALERSREIGYVFQNPEHQFVTERVSDELAFGLRLRGLDDAQAARRVEAALQRFGLTDDRDRSPFTLSHGQKRRLSVATMLVAGQRTLILDEPTFGQDAAHAEALLELLGARNAEGTTIVLVTHDMRLVSEHARHVAVLGDGQLHFHGTPAELFAQPRLLATAALDLPPLTTMLRPLVTHWPQLAGIPDLATLVGLLGAGEQRSA